MRKDLLAIGLGVVLSAVTVFSSSAAGTVALRDQVPAAVSRGLVRPNGLVDSEKTMEIAISLPLRNREALTNLLHDISDPNSQNFHHYLTPAQFTDVFGPTEKQYQQVINFAKSHHLEIVRQHANRVVLTVRGRAADIQSAFNVTLRTYQHPTENRTFFAPDTDPTVDSSLPIYQVSGLDNYSIRHPESHLKTLVPMPSGNPQTKAAANANPNAGSGPGGSYQGTDFRTAYIPGTILNGAGQNVALLEFDGFFASDIAAYEAQIGLTGQVPNLIVKPVDGGVPVPGPASDEVSLDIEMVVSMAPGVNNIYVYEAPLAAPWEDILNAIADDDVAKQISSSWGGGVLNPDLAAEQIFQQMAVQGQSYFNASGDFDALLSNIPFPSDSPNVTSVGGTTLTTGNSATYTSEKVWNWTSIGRDGIGSSGGVSAFYAIPSWQTNINMTTRGGLNTKRNFPDVALTADNVFVIFGNGQSGIFGGTSCAAPLWAGFTALINQQAALNGRASVGFLNPALYTIAQGSSYNSCFHDTVLGDSTWSGSPTLFKAVLGYDLCTGLGTPNGTNLINDLVAITTPPVHISPPPPPYGSTLGSVAGGNPNGSWDLFIQDDAPIGAGVVGNGWVLSLTTADVIGTSGDNEVLMTTSNSTVIAGQPVTFFVTVTNYGPSVSTNVIVVDTLPLTTTILSTNTTIGSVSRAGTTLTWNVGDLSVGTGGAMTLTVQPNGLGSLVNLATVSAGTPDPNPDDDVASTNLNVVPLSFTVSPGFSNGTFHVSIPGPVVPGLIMVIQANSNLVSTNWVNVYTGTPPINFVDPASSSYPSRFYRAVVLP